MVFAMVDDIPSVARIINVKSRAGDVNGDGSVNINDLLAVVNAWGPCSAFPAPCPADLDHDGAVSINDLLLVVQNWG